MTAPIAVAAFDFDGTLTDRDTLVPFLALLVGRRALVAAAARELPALTGAYAGLGSRDEAKARLLRRLLPGRSAPEVQALGSDYGSRLVSNHLRPDMVDRLEWHRERGHRLVIVSASLDSYLRTVASALGCDGLLCTTLEVDSSGLLTGEMVDGNCRGPEKRRRLQSWLDERGLGDAPVWAYGDSSGDRELLAMADHPVWVRSSEAVARDEI